MYYKKKNEIPIYRGILFLFVIYISIILFIGVTINLYTKNILSTSLDEKQFKVLIALLFGSLFLINIIRYGRKKSVQKIVERYENHGINDKFKTWMIFLIPIFFLVLTISMVLITKALK